MSESAFAQDDQDKTPKEPAARSELPPIAVSVDPTTVEAIQSAPELRAYYHDLQSQAREQSYSNLSQINEDTRVAREAAAEQNASAWNKVQADYVEGLKKLESLDLDADQKQRRREELSTTKDEALKSLAKQKEMQSTKINAERESRRAAELTRMADFDSNLNLQLKSQLENPKKTLTRANDEQATGSAAAEPDDATSPGSGGFDLSGTVDLDTPGDEILANANPDQYRMREQLFEEEQERRRRAEEEAASRLDFIQVAQARAYTTASASSLRPERNCEAGADADGDGVDAVECGGSDCDDYDPNRYPGNTEIGDPDGHDEDCDPETFGNVDRDRDGFFSALFCNDGGGGQLNCGTDCDDSDPSVHPIAGEACNHIDDNCDGRVDEGGVLGTKYLDRDGDLHGDPDYSLMVCAQTNQNPYGDGDWLSAIGNDCDDTDPTTWQGCSQ